MKCCPDTYSRFAGLLSDAYREAMGVEPQRVELHRGEEIALAFLYGASTPAEKALWTREDGCRLLHDYLAACTKELLPGVRRLVEEELGVRLRRLLLESAYPTEHKILVLVLEPGPRQEEVGGS